MELDDILRLIVSARLGGHCEGDHPATRAALEAKFATISPARTDDQWSNWFGLRWAEKGSWHPRTKQRVLALVARLAEGKDGAKMISRREVFDSDGDSVDLFLAAMAWGFGPRGYGWWRTAEMVSPNGRNEEARISAAVAAYRSAFVEGGAEAVARSWTSGHGKIIGLGPAFASKIAYFSIYERRSAAGPLIADLNTAWSVWALGGISNSRSQPARYSDYVKWCEFWAAQLEPTRRSDDVERVLFTLGPTIRRIYRELESTHL